MLGAIIGDISGSFREFSKNKYKELGLLPKRADLNSIIPNVRYGITDDSVLTFATAFTCLKMRGKTDEINSRSFADAYHSFGRQYDDVIGGYGFGFNNWLSENEKNAYNSCGNGSAMRVSPVAYVGVTLSEVRELAFNSACATHNHPEGIKGAQATAISIYLARNGMNMQQIADELYDMKLHYEPISQFDHFDSICQDTMRLAMHVLLTTSNFYDAVFKAVTIPNADSDTLGAIVGAIAESLYGISDDIKETALTFIYDKDLRIIYEDFTKYYVNMR
jgi:type I restriction enzyme M protein